MGVLHFRSVAYVTKPAKARLRAAARLSVQRSMIKLAALGHYDPDAALLIERSIDDYLPAEAGPDWAREPRGPRPRRPTRDSACLPFEESEAAAAALQALAAAADVAFARRRPVPTWKRSSR